jgi:lysyl-tRNA synthetase class 2
MTETPWWHPHRHADRRPALMARNRIQQAIRAWLVGQDFVEVDPAALQFQPRQRGASARLPHHRHRQRRGGGGPLPAHQPRVCDEASAGRGRDRIASFTHVWRNRERGPLHEPEFTMLEWYRVGEGYEVLMEDIAAWVRLACDGLLRFRDRTCDPAAAYERVSVAEAFPGSCGHRPDGHAGL